MANTYQLISSVTVGSGGASSIDFTSIPATYTDLVVRLSARSTRNDGVLVDSFVLKVNGSGTSYTNRILYSAPGALAPTSGTDTSSLYGIAGATSAQNTASTFGNAEFYIPNYAGSNNKSSSFDGVGENNAQTAWMALGAGLWSNTSAITSIAITCASGSNWVQYSTAYLYGVKNS